MGKSDLNKCYWNPKRKLRPKQTASTSVQFFKKMLNAGVANGFNIQYHQHLIPPSVTRPQALGFSRTSSYNVERGGQTASFNICDNKRNVEQMLKQGLNAFKLIQN